LHIGVASFFCYFFVYFFKVSIFVLPRTSGAGARTVFGGRMELNMAFALAQTLGYGLSKLPATAVVSAAPDGERRRMLFALLSLAALTLGFGVALLPAEGKVLAVFAASFPASWIYGVLLRWVEGRIDTEPLAAALSVSWIFGGGAARGAAGAALNMPWLCGAGGAAGDGGPGAAGGVGASEFMMPLALALVALPVCLGCAAVLDRAPAPTTADVALRSVHGPMTLSEQRAFVGRFPAGIGVLLLLYMLVTVRRCCCCCCCCCGCLLTLKSRCVPFVFLPCARAQAFRNFRDYFMPQIFREALGHDLPASDYFWAEMPGGIVAALAFGAARRFAEPRAALRWLHFLMAAGLTILGAATALFASGGVGIVAFYTLISVGLYLAYSVMGIGIYDRLIAASQASGTCVGLTFVSDGLGYVATISILLFKSFGSFHGSYLGFLKAFALATSVGGVALVAVSMAYFERKLATGMQADKAQRRTAAPDDGQHAA
jgi:hypothetical protein